ncbi:DUF134 domain-containing protein [Candidatus Gracilibacteria bacterium]|nr:DUF134 domain-containing protein [Candidatus Gracilibacteria bacterium]NUJ99177.1 DUF134 domain-containing protein [Candidatus Gracilibacteria bacterium]
MARPKKGRNLSCHPIEQYFFKPAGIPINNLEIIELEKDEIEILKLVNLEGKTMQEGAEKLGISASTFNRNLNVVYKKLSEALLYGKAIKINS